MKRALDEMVRRRVKQLAYNKKHHITPKTIIKSIQELEEFRIEAQGAHIGETLFDEKEAFLHPEKIPGMVKDLEKQMLEAADNLQFELAAVLRDKINEIRQMTTLSGAKK